MNVSIHTKCVSLSKRKCEIQPTLINLHPNKYSQELQYYPFVVKLYRCVGSCNTLNDLSNKKCIPNKSEDLNIHVSNLIKEKMNQRFLQNIYHANVNVNLMVHYVLQIKNGIMIDVDVSVKIVKYLFINDSVITCDEVIETTKTVPTSFNEKK